MPTPKVNFDRLAAPPSQTERESSIRTHEMIRRDIDADPLLSGYDIETLLQGSYRTATNIGNHSDVDIRARCKLIYHYDVSRLSVEEQLAVNRSGSPATTTFWDYRRDLLASLEREYPGQVTNGNKAFKVNGNTYRMDADVLPCLAYRYYTSVYTYEEGICFFPRQGSLICNFPRQHYDNLASKHRDTDEQFKGMVRIYKRLRNELVAQGKLTSDSASSCGIESLLWNVPDHMFRSCFDESVYNVTVWLHSDLVSRRQLGTLDEYSEANGLMKLFHPRAWNANAAIAMLEGIAGYFY